jgi:hypothetical protein
MKFKFVLKFVSEYLLKVSSGNLSLEDFVKIFQFKLHFLNTE